MYLCVTRTSDDDGYDVELFLSLSTHRQGVPTEYCQRVGERKERKKNLFIDEIEKEYCTRYKICVLSLVIL